MALDRVQKRVRYARAKRCPLCMMLEANADTANYKGGHVDGLSRTLEQGWFQLDHMYPRCIATHLISHLPHVPHLE